MVRGRIMAAAMVGGLILAGTALAGCGGGATGKRAVAPGGLSTTSLAPTTTTAPAPATTAPDATAPDATAPATTPPAPASTSPSTTAGTTAPSNANPLLIVRSSGGSISYEGRRPVTIDFSVDSTNIVGHLSWNSWGSAAVGHGYLGLNNCRPNCAQGTVTQVPATIDLGAVAGGHFTAMTEKAGSFFRRYSYPSSWASGAS